jgi:hypothetical protein
VSEFWFKQEFEMAEARVRGAVRRLDEARSSTERLRAGKEVNQAAAEMNRLIREFFNQH